MDIQFTHVGVRIITRLKELRLKQADLCRDTGISSNAISQYCTGKRIPDTTSLYKMATVLKTSMEWILSGKYPSIENTTIESIPCDGKPLSADESDLVAMYRLIDERDQRTILDLTMLKYQQLPGEKLAPPHEAKREAAEQPRIPFAASGWADITPENDTMIQEKLRQFEKRAKELKER